MIRLPRTNADGLSPIELSSEQKFLFDTRGWLMIPGVLSESEINEAREFCRRLHQDALSIPIADRSSIGGPLLKLVDHPVIVGFMNEFVADPYIWSEGGYGFRMENSFLAVRKAGDSNFGPHGGNGSMSFGYNSHLYRQNPGSVFSGLTRAVWELNPVLAGEGGTKFLTGSHKAAFAIPDSMQQADSPLWDEYSCPAGSVLFFTEGICHTGAKWTNAKTDRVAIFNCYNAIGSRWHNWEPTPEALAEMSPLRRSLFRKVCCDNNLVHVE